MNKPLPAVGLTFMAMFTTITQQIEILRTSANQLLNETEELNRLGKTKEAAAKIAASRGKIEEAERLSGRIVPQPNKRRKAG